jgi:hypothetical protein
LSINLPPVSPSLHKERGKYLYKRGEASLQLSFEGEEGNNIKEGLNAPLLYYLSNTLAK